MPKRRKLYTLFLLACISLAGTALYLKWPPSARDGFKDLPSSLTNPQAQPAPTDSLSTAPLSKSPNLPTSVPTRNSKSWDQANILLEAIEDLSDKGPGKFVLRHRIIKDLGFNSPIRITDGLELDETGIPKTSFERSAYVANQVLLHSPTRIPAEKAQDIADSLGWKIINAQSSQYLVVLQADTFELSTVQDAISAIDSSQSDLSAEPNHIFYALASPNDPRYSANSQWGLHQDSDFDIDAPEGWDIRNSAPSATIAIIDTGINPDHEDLKANLWNNLGDQTRDGVDNDGNGYTDDTYGFNFIDPNKPPTDDNGHGTHISGIAGARGNNHLGIAGVAWDVNLMPIKALNADGKGTTSALVSAIDYAIKKDANIINASWGSDTFNGAIEEAISRAKDKGIIVVAAAGNEGSDTPAYPSRSPLPNVVSVGSVDSSGAISSFSNYHPNEVDVMAPGTSVFSTWHQENDAYSRQDGTSMAAPFVSGILALYLAEYPDDSYEIQIRRLIASSEKIEGFQKRCASEGLVNLKNGLLMDTVTFPPNVAEGTEREIEAYEGESINLVARATDAKPLTYKWTRDGSTLSETSSTLLLNAVTLQQRGAYTLEISNDEASTIVHFDLKVYPRMHNIEALIKSGLVIYASHEDHWNTTEEGGEQLITSGALTAGEKSFLEVRTPKHGMLRYSAKKPLVGQTYSSTLLLGPNSTDALTSGDWESLWVSSLEEAPYTARITHQAGPEDLALPEGSLALRIPEFFEKDKLPPIIHVDFYSQKLTLGRTLRLSVWSGQENLSYQWYKNDLAMAGRTDNVMEIESLTADDQGYYHLDATNDFGSSTSTKAYIEIDTSPQPASASLANGQYLNIKSGDPLNLAMKVTGSLPITYQWYKDAKAIPGATQEELHLGPASVAHSGRYYLSVANELNPYPYNSSYVTVDVTEEIFPPRFTRKEREPVHYYVAEGSSLTLSIPDPDGSPQFSYSWYKDGQPVENELLQDNHYTKPSAQKEDAGTYYLEARNNLGSDQSHRLIVHITRPPIEAIDLPSETITGNLPSSTNAAYAIYQTEETWDGVDALEISSSQGLFWVNFAAKPDARFLKFRWKLPSDSKAGFQIYLQNQMSSEFSLELKTKGIWQEDSIFVPENHILKFRLDPDDGPSKAWLDGFERVESPALLEDISFTPPFNGKPVRIEASFFGQNTSYQWYRNGAPLVGANSSSLLINAFNQGNAGNYQLKAQNAFGAAETSLVAIGLDSLASLIPTALNLSFTGDPKLKIQPTDSLDEETHLLIEVGDNQNWEVEKAWAFTSPVTGPAILDMDYNFRSINAFITLDGVDKWIPTDFRNTTTLFIPAGSHTLSISVGPTYLINSGKIYSITLKNEPLAILEQAYESHYNAQFTPFATYAGAEPLTLTWFQNGQQISQRSNLSSGESFPFERDSTMADQGDYYFEVVDSNGLKATSNSVTYELPQFIAEALDSPAGDVGLHSSGHTTARYDTTTKTKGSASLLLEGPFTEIEGSMVKLSARTIYGKFKIRSEGFPTGSVINYVLDGETISTPANADWTEITAGNGPHGIAFTFTDSNEQSRIWIDDFTTIKKGIFTRHPQPTETFLGATIKLDAAAYEPAVYLLGLRWYKDGQEIPNNGAYAITINSITLDDLGEYIAKATSPNGEVISSKPAKLSIIGNELAAAIGLPGARITTQGAAPWRVDYENSIDGPSSIVSGKLEPGESSTITIDLDEPVSWGIYSYLSSNVRPYGASDENEWVYNNAGGYNPAKSKRLALTVHEFTENEQPLNRSLRLDRGRLTRLSSLQFEPWLTENLPANRLPNADIKSNRLADFDKDNIPNWLEFALGLDPAQADTTPSWGITKLTPQNVEASISFLAARSDDYSISYEGSFDHITWFPVFPKLETVTSGINYNEVKATVTLGPDNQNPNFIRWTIHDLTEKNPGTFHSPD